MKSPEPAYPPERPDREPEKQALHAAIEQAAHYLPAQGPIATFVHHNTLHAFQSERFHEAVEHAARKLGVEGYLREDEFRAAYAVGRIDDEDLEKSLEAVFPEDASAATAKPLPRGVSARAVRKAMLHGAPAPIGRAAFVWQKHERGLLDELQPFVPYEQARGMAERTTRWLGKAWAEARSPQEKAALVLDPVDEARQPRPADAGKLFEELRRAPSRLAPRALFAAAVRLTDTLGFSDPPARADGSHGQRLADLVHPTLIPLCAAFLDHGVAAWGMEARSRGFYRAWRALYTQGNAAEPRWLRGLRRRLKEAEARGDDAEDVVLAALREKGLAEDAWTSSLEETLLRLPGWAGMFHRLEHQPLRGTPPTRLVDFLAVRLTLDAYAERALATAPPSTRALEPPFPFQRAYTLFLLAQRLGLAAPDLLLAPEAEQRNLLELLASFGDQARRRVWQEAYERHYRVRVLGAIADRRRDPAPTPVPASLQVAFCIDDREESIRRHLEELDPTVETLGVAGFFGLAIEYRGLDDVETAALCPVGAEPAWVVTEHPPESEQPVVAARHRRRKLGAWIAHVFRAGSHAALPGTAIAAGVGPATSVALAARVLFPRTVARTREAAVRTFLPSPRTHLRHAHPHRHGAPEAQGPAHRPSMPGLVATAPSPDDAATRIASTLENMGLTKGFAPLVILLGHGSTSANNPHASAYDCGACGGRHGGANARLFARLANAPEVRERLRARGIDVPDGTYFVGGLHNTCDDSIRLFDEELVPAAVQPRLRAAARLLERARAKNAQERCRKFASAPARPTPEEALAHVEARAADLSQPRPELGHATNAATIVGRRDLTRGVFFDRRAFLPSYDPDVDTKDGRILERVLSAVMPVCAGISLEYYFSRVDNQRLGAGTKLPHNVTGHIGVMDGPASDLKTGLPAQMVEIHEPMRSLFVVEATTDVLESILTRNATIRELVDNQWVQLVALDPKTGAMAMRQQGRFAPAAMGPGRTPRVERFDDHYLGKDGFVDPMLEPSHALTRGGSPRAA